ncbi:EAL domain-containing protein [Altericista sp. CCNU0014]|uniref:EAL domain-containing protein n=1 Tax=Altericista sp. CCNU0014 TaxID=3082949 RepID=UPI00384DD68F
MSHLPQITQEPIPINSPTPLRCLFLEDAAEDAQRIVLTLKEARLPFTHDLADDIETFEDCLRRQTYDIVCSEYRLSNCTGLEAFQRLQASGQEIPFILVTGSLGEEAAVECIKAGMTDCILKDRLVRLPLAIERALKEFDLRRQQHRAMMQLKQQAWREAILNRIIQAMREPLVLEDVLQVTTEEIQDALGISQSFIVWQSPEGQLQLAYASHSMPNRAETIGQPYSCPLYVAYRAALERGQSVALSRIDDSLPEALQATAAEFGFKAVVLVPIMHQQAFIGFMCLQQCDREREWNEGELALMVAVVDRCAIAMHQAQLYQTTRTELAECRRVEEQLRHHAFHDPLTNLPNRALLTERLQHALDMNQRRAARYSTKDLPQVAVLFLDLDRFKVINDSLGHVLGDALLKVVAQRLESSLRRGDTIARIGGDEFVFLLEDVKSLEDALEVAERIRYTLKPAINLEGHEMFVSVSIGIALGALHYTQAEQILRDADIAMYKAKQQGPGRHEAFDTSMHAAALERLHLEHDLQRALERQEFWLYYQPIVDLQTQKLSGFEALLRWQHPERGLVMPGAFMAVAEETGSIEPIGQWVLQEACRQLKQWQLEGPQRSALTVNVNLSARQFSQPHLLHQIDLTLKQTGLDARSLKLEITESTLIGNPDLAVSVLQALRDRQIDICIDDFGIGYSSLSHLHRFPINMLKIDRSFVAQVREDTAHHEILKAIIHLGHNLGLKVIVEGVETAQQLALLKANGCLYGQGYWFDSMFDSMPQFKSA